MNDHEFTEVINKIALLKSIKPDEDFKIRMEKKVLSYASPSRFAMPMFAFRVAMIVFVILTSGTTLVMAAQQSKPGDALYPLKKVVDSVKINFNSETELSKVPTPEPTKLTPTREPDPTMPEPTPTTIRQNQPVQQPVIKQLPTITPTIIPTAIPVNQGIVPAVKGTVDTVVDTLPVKLPLGGTSQPTPTPQPNNVGSKDNGSDAGAGGSLLPKIKIKL
jgi:hypothetical protein